ncbi:hypothetical protein [uncultured Dokdonia sp.]|uniref:hypothetical protein n=1 Tax=uncultured Dokdonia sp. TaxID=575653 RepID=UPI0026281324|nr:hypothetical protein [uncultured Dokdonia sp.]
MELCVSKSWEEKNKKDDVLNYHLRHLEFILFFEIQLEQTYTEDCSWRFLEKFKALKQEAQMNVLKYSSHYQKQQNIQFHSSTLNGYSPTVPLD